MREDKTCLPLVELWTQPSILDDAVNTVTYTFNAAGTKIQAVAVYVETPKYMEAFGMSDLPVPASPGPAPSPSSSGNSVNVGFIIAALFGGVFIGIGMYGVFLKWRGRSTGGHQMTSSSVALVGQRRTTNEQMNPARQSIVDAMDKDDSATLA